MTCLCCGNNKAESMFKWPGAGFLVHFNRCRNCGFWFQEPVSSEEELAMLYDDEFFEVFVKHFLSFRTRQYKKDLKFINSLKPEKGRLLDVGCALGLFLNEAKIDGWDVLGNDVSKQAAAHVRQKYAIEVILGDLAKAGLKEACFDAITGWDVIEHLKDPAAFVISAYRLLKKGGVLALRTPNANGLLLKIVKIVNLIPGEMFAKIAPRFKHHIYLFSPAAIRLLLESRGFEVLKVDHDVEDLVITDKPSLVNYLKAFARKCIKLIEYLIPPWRDSLVVYAKKR